MMVLLATSVKIGKIVSWICVNEPVHERYSREACELNKK